MGKYFLFGSLIISPLLYGMDDSQYLLVMDLVISFHQGQRFAVEGYEPPFAVYGRLLEQDYTCGKVQTVYLNLEGLCVL